MLLSTLLHYLSHIECFAVYTKLHYLSHILGTAAGCASSCDQGPGAGGGLTTCTMGVKRFVSHGLADVVCSVGMDRGAGDRGHTGNRGGEGGVPHLDNLLTRCKTDTYINTCTVIRYIHVPVHKYTSY